MLPDPKTFATAYDAGQAQPVWTTAIADLETPVSAYLKLAPQSGPAFLLESVEGGSVRGRYSFIGLEPDLIWQCRGSTAEISRTAPGSPPVFIKDARPTLSSLQAVIDDSRIDLPPALPPMAAGLVGYMGYDTVRLSEVLPDSNPDRLGIPDGLFVRPTVMVIFDNVDGMVTVVTPVRPDPAVPAATARAAAEARISDILSRFERPAPRRAVPDRADKDIGEPVSNTGRDGYHRMVVAAKEYIFAGDIFQVVPSQRLRAPFPHPPFSLYRSLRRTNPSPFLFFLDFEAFSLIGSSPEILVRLRDGTVTIRPIAGTRRRGKTPAEDKELAADLLADPKELAEHLMLLDLGRNDVGRVCKPGTVRVTEQMTIEYYSHVMHIVSNVEGEIRDGLDAMAALMAGFPAGTVSGAPKIRAMEIIDELETERRGFYGGAVGYIAANGDMDTCIALRTAMVKDGTLYMQAGGGVVADSDPEAEYQESRNKAEAIYRAAAEAHLFLTGD